MRSNLPRKLLTCFMAGVFALAMSPGALEAGPSPAPAPLPVPAQVAPPGQAPPARLTQQQIQDLVAPVALYPDALLAQILAASAYPTQIVEAQRFLQQNPNLKGAALAAEVNKQDWDPSVKALTQFPSVLANLDTNLSWTSELGDVNLNQAQDVMDAVQVLRRDAEQAGNLKSTPQQTVTNQGSTVVVQPVNPEVVYVPVYDPELVYGYPLGLWPGLYPWWGVGPYISFGIGCYISPFFAFGWGWPAWGFNWFHGGIYFGGGRYFFHNRGFYARNAYFHGNYRGYSGNYYRGFVGARSRGFAAPSGRAGRGFAAAPYNRGERGFARPSARNQGGFRSFNTRSFNTPTQRSFGPTRGNTVRSFSPQSRGSVGVRGGGYSGFRGGGGMRGGFGGGHSGGGHGGGRGRR